ncbi:DUF421 domain-containing protein [Mammaliicoccus sciuri]|uniref:Uncharacterized membrane protein YcaP, DUF421 family n=2 Tax=Sporosarcina newyorkensis TaxID=759851 RepID=A0A1T4XN53_9BACL|nr:MULTISPECIES: DUF421 domain-containing protein [Sporosarcina]EGQ22594.1 hypothetical membrane Associated protein [Sporosarcina newyorkensis 2681]MBY0222565.1 DUF421 domain-containing protein [Sporosarcina aquimarina]SKA90578.1 Uncharacterized membrane protein YcaP, DUF421 family [Sporosarcina newyorkensis]
MHEYVIIGLRTIFLYVFLLVILRIMGKREVGELGVIDIVVFIIMAEVAAMIVETPDKPIIVGVLPILLLLVIQYISSLISLKSKKFRDVVDGNPTLIIKDGQIQEQEMRKQRYNLDDLFQQLRENQIGSIHNVTYAYLEPSGNLSVFTRDGDLPIVGLVLDGEIQEEHLRLVGKTEEWLLKQLQDQNISDVSTVFYCSWEQGDLKIQMKES